MLTLQLGWSSLGMVCKEGIVLACERKLPSKLLIPSSVQKIHEIDSHIMCSSSGLQSDAKSLISYARTTAAVSPTS